MAYTAYSTEMTGQGFDNSVSIYLNSITDFFDATKTYAISEKVIYDAELYECTTAITTPAAWDSSKWTKIKIFERDDTEMWGGTADTGVVQTGDKLNTKIAPIFNVNKNESELIID